MCMEHLEICIWKLISRKVLDHLNSNFAFSLYFYYPGLHLLKRILREGFHILSSDPSTQDIFIKPPSVTFRKPPNLRQLIVDTSLTPATPTGSRSCNRPRCKTCPIHPPASSFTSSCTNLTYPITTHADCKSMKPFTCSNVMYAVLFTLEKLATLSLTAWMGTVSPPQSWTQTYRLPSTPNPTKFHIKIAGLLA